MGRLIVDGGTHTVRASRCAPGSQGGDFIRLEKVMIYEEPCVHAALCRIFFRVLSLGGIAIFVSYVRLKLTGLPSLRAILDSAMQVRRLFFLLTSPHVR